VRSNPYYVVANTKQIKPFLLLVHGTGDPAPQATVHGSLFQHDPGLALKSRFGGQLIQLVSAREAVAEVRKCQTS
jgi:hypothetical protein